MPSHPTLSLDGKVALVTGGSRGIGAATVRLFVRPALASSSITRRQRRSGAPGRRMGAESATRCRPTSPAPLAPSRWCERQRTLWRARRAGRQPRHLAGDDVPDRPDDRPAVEPHHRRQPRQRLRPREALGGADEATGARRAHRPHQLHRRAARRSRSTRDYAATKGALISMTKGLSTELAPFGIYVNCVAPGWVDTDMSADALADPERQEDLRRHSAGTRRHTGRDRRADPVPVHALRRLHHRRDFQREWRGGAGGVGGPPNTESFRVVITSGLQSARDLLFTRRAGRQAAPGLARFETRTSFPVHGNSVRSITARGKRFLVPLFAYLGAWNLAWRTPGDGAGPAEPVECASAEFH